MELTRKDLTQRLKSIGDRVSHDHLLLFSSSISYYSALALAPFMLIILWVASLVGQNVQQQIIEHARQNFSHQIVETLELIFRNVNERVNVGSISGLLGLLILLWTCSIVFLQFRHAFDVIYGNWVPQHERRFKEIVLERLFAMAIVLAAALLLIVSFAVTGWVEYAMGPGHRGLLLVMNFLIYVQLFTLIHYLIPTRRPQKLAAVKTAVLSSVFFFLGNILLTSYLKGIARSSVYGAAGVLVVFLVWAHYSSFTILLSVEFYRFFERRKKTCSDT